MPGRRVIALAAVLAGLSAGVAALAFHIDIRSDLGFFLPRGASTISDLVASRLREGPTSGLILAAIEGGDAASRNRASDNLVRELTKTGLFTFVANGRARFEKADLEAMLGYRYRLNPPLSADDFSPDALRGKLTEALRLLGTTAGMAIKEILPRDPTLRALEIATLWAGKGGPKKQGGVWVSANGERALFVALPKADAFDFNSRQAVFDKIHAAFRDTRRNDALTLRLTGPSVIALESRDRIKTEAQWLAALSFVLIGALLLAVFRSPAMLLIVAIPIAAGLLAGTACVQIVFGHIHGITLAFGNILIGVATDYPMHLAVHRGPRESTAQAARRIWPTLRLGALTTVVAFLPMSAAGFPGLSELGVFAAAGLLAAAAITRWVLPAVMAPADRVISIKGLERLMDKPGWTQWTPPVAGLAAVISVAFLVHDGNRIWENDLRALSPVPKTSLDLDRSLRADLAGPDVRRMIVITGTTPEQVLQALETGGALLREARTERKIAEFDMAARYLPSARRQREQQKALPDSALLGKNLNQALDGLPFRADTFAPFLNDVERARTEPPIGFEDFAAGRFGWRITPLLFPHGGRWTGLVTLSGLSGALPREITQRMSDTNRATTADFVDLKQETDLLMSHYRDTSLLWLGVGALAAVALLFVGLRHPGNVLRVIAPVAAAMTITTALLVASGAALSVIHVMALLLVAGLGLDYALFLNRSAESDSDSAQAKLAVILANLTTVMVFAVMAFSQIPVLNSMGRTVAVGAVLSLFLANGFRNRSSVV